jgi:hypothetical protein
MLREMKACKQCWSKLKSNAKISASLPATKTLSPHAPLSYHAPQKSHLQANLAFSTPHAACFAEHTSQLAARDHPLSRVKNLGAKRCVK